MKKYISILFLFFNLVQCYSQDIIEFPKEETKSILKDSLMHRENICKLKQWLGGRIDSETFYSVRDAAYGYSFLVPKEFKEVIDTISSEYNDTTIFISQDKKCHFYLWADNSIYFPIGKIYNGKELQIHESDIYRVDSIVKNYVDNIKAGKNNFLINIIIDELCISIKGYEYQISIKGKTSNECIIYKTEISELAVSGDLIFKNFLYTYKPDLTNDYYEFLGIIMANSFGGRNWYKNDH